MPIGEVLAEQRRYVGSTGEFFVYGELSPASAS